MSNDLVGCAVVTIIVPVGLYLIVRHHKQKRLAWAEFARRHGMQARDLRIEGSYEGYKLLLEEVVRGSGKQRTRVTELRVRLGDSVPREFSLELENLGDKMAKVLGRKTDMEIGHKAFDERFRLRNVSEQLAGVLDNPAVRDQLNVMAGLYQTFNICDGWLVADFTFTPASVTILEEFVGPALLLAHTLEESSQHLQRLMKG